MTDKTMTPDEEHAFYADPDNQLPQGPPVSRRPTPPEETSPGSVTDPPRTP